MTKKRFTTPCIINCSFYSTYENPRGFSIQFVFTKLGAESTQTNHTQTRCQ